MQAINIKICFVETDNDHYDILYDHDMNFYGVFLVLFSTYLLSLNFDFLRVRLSRYFYINFSMLYVGFLSSLMNDFLSIFLTNIRCLTIIVLISRVV